jgi:hypothetical protein
VRDATFYASSLLELHRLPGAAERRASWRQSIAALARVAFEEGPGPLEGLHPEALAAGVRTALQAGLVDDLDWLAAPAAGAALWELASALPIGPEQREVGRRVLSRLLAGDAETFVAIARRMALGGGKGLATAAVRARVALVMELPLGLDVAGGPLALAIASRRELAREWISAASTGSLPSRRLAARLIEHAAREAAKRAAQGDDHNLRVFRSDAVKAAWGGLLADRESLVWRHVAVARGLLAPWAPELAREIDAALAPSLSPTEWRRAAASIAARVAVAPDDALAQAQRALAQGLLERDPGASSAFVWGLPRAAEAEPEAADELLDLVLARAGADIGEAVIDLRAELGPSALGDRAAVRALAALQGRGKVDGDDGAAAIAREVARDLESGPRDDEPLRDVIARALRAFAEEGSKGAHARARDALSAARGSLEALEAASRDEDGSIARRTSLAVLRDLDLSLLERDVLAHLLVLGGGGDAPRAAQEALDGMRDRLAEWILSRESTPIDAGPDGKARLDQPTLALRRLRALLHLVDGDVDDEDDTQRAARLRKRCFRVARVLVERFERDPPSPVRRTVVAALARALDALVRAGACDVSDALLVAARRVADPAALSTLSEASMDPDLVHVLSRYAQFAGSVAGADAASPENVAPSLAAFDELAGELASNASGRTEALRTVLVRLGGALGAIAAAPSLRALGSSVGADPGVVAGLESALQSLTQLVIGARGRLDPERPAAAPLGPALQPLHVAVARVLGGADERLGEHAVAASLDDLLAGVPKAIAKLVSPVVWRMAELPVDQLATDRRTSARTAEALPTWLPARRTVGGFYVLRALSAGAVGSVFVVTRVEEKNDADAEKLALKVPEYSATMARSLSEAEFLKMFRDEAGTLITLPQHPNLARFVTFDAGSKPKPILVMELVEGVTLERLLETRSLDMSRALGVLDDVLAGLEAMHAVGVAHLDLKPSNVVMRGDKQGVLVDFGLAGKHIRPGCATGPYGAPEVWGALDDEKIDPAPPKADVYAFGCVAFEALTGRVLFEAPTEMAQIAMHLAHDGFPPQLRALAKRADLAPITELLFATLRRDPRERPAASAVRKELARMSSAVRRAPWPLG